MKAIMGWLLVFLCFSGLLHAQGVFSGDSVVHLAVFEVSSERLDNYAAGQKMLTPDSLILTLNNTMNLGELAERYSSLQTKTYNFNGLSTISFRGTAAEHTGVYWNGLLLNPSGNGLIDFSLVPTGYFGDVHILYGGGSSLFGSGNIGGSIHLNTHPVFMKTIKAGAGMGFGSFGEYSGNAAITLAGNKLFSQTRAIHRTSCNDFEYLDIYGENQRQQHALSRQYGFIQDLYVRLGTKLLLGGAFWYQDNYRQIPPSLTQTTEDATQEDRSVRGMITARKFIGHHRIAFRGGLFHDESGYFDPGSSESSRIDSEIATDKINTELQFDTRISQYMDFSTGISFINEHGNSKNWNGKVFQNTTGIFAMIRVFMPSLNWKANLNFRQNFTGGYRVPFTPALGLEGHIWKPVSGKISISKNFRIPTFNERFWVPGGNEDLDPEESWNGEAGLECLLTNKQVTNKGVVTMTVFSSSVENRILWVPEGSYSVPENVKKVWSRGIEFTGMASFSFNGWQIKPDVGFTYVKSTHQTKLSPADDTYGKQLIYVPEHRFNANLTITFRGNTLLYGHVLTGKRYTTTDNSAYLPYYDVGNLTLSRDIDFGKHSFALRMEIRNVWEEEYQAVAFYPMPGRYYRISLNYYLN
ncbi:MAG: TonB-dependent receptor [Bacteroidales bacterium]|nr:TonB-dependent receptor [Bacteroidales bacterium]